jgi:hypothetical protein
MSKPALNPGIRQRIRLLQSNLHQRGVFVLQSPPDSCRRPGDGQLIGKRSFVSALCEHPLLEIIATARESGLLDGINRL